MAMCLTTPPKGGAKVLAKLGSLGLWHCSSCSTALSIPVSNSLAVSAFSLSKRVMAGVNKAVTKINDFETTAAELAIEKKYDYVICGHIHQPQKRMVTTDKGSVMYLNSGDWDRTSYRPGIS